MKFMLDRSGFALPTVLLASVIMLIVLVSAATASSSMRAALNTQYYEQLAREAAESGLARAKDCLSNNAYVAQWSNASPLRPNTSCSGGAGCTALNSNCYIVANANMRSTFTVNAPVDQSVSQLVSVEAKVELIRSSNGAVWRTYTETLSARVGADLSLNTVAFGYIGAVGAYFLTITEDGKLNAVGNNFYGQLGNGTTTNTATPTTYKLPGGYKPSQVFTSFLSMGRNVFVVTDGGYLFGAGSNAYGQLGNGATATAQTTPVQFVLPGSQLAKSVGVLGYATYVLTNSNNIYAAGLCDYGQLGTNYTITGCSNVSTPARVALPTPSGTNTNTLPTTNISVDRNTAVLRMQGGRVYGWGRNDYGQFGNGGMTDSSTPVQIGLFGNSGSTKAVQVATDGVSIWILDDAGKVYAAGYNFFGQLGDGTTTNSSSLVEFTLPDPNDRVTKITTDQWSCLVLTDKGEVWGRGWNNDGQLGNGTTTEKIITPMKFILPTGVKAVDLYNTASGAYPSTPYNNTYVIGSDGKVYGAGSNDFGQLGDGTTTDRATPVPMQVIDGSNIKAQQVQAGFGTAVIVTTNQKIYTVGNNGNGQLGDGTTTNSSVPKANRYTNVLPVTSF